MKFETLQLHTQSRGELGPDPRVFAAAFIQDGALNLKFRTEPSISSSITAMHMPERRDELWKETCFEAFIKGASGSTYIEFNGSAQGAWNLYQFDSYREGMTPVVVPQGQEPKTRIPTDKTFDGQSFEIEFSIPLELLKLPTPWRLGISMVWKIGSHPYYFALRHSGERPDFHQESSFIYGPIRN